MEENLVSVIVPAYNSEKEIERCINSVLSQSYKKIELLVINDGSKDNTGDIVERISVKEKRLKLITKNNGGAARARNIGIKAAAGDYIAFLDSDDEWHPEKLKVQLSKIQKENSEFCHCAAVQVDASTNRELPTYSWTPYSGLNVTALATENTITTSSVIVKKSLILEAGLFNEDLHGLEDWDLWLKIAVNHKISVVKKPLVLYYVRPNSITRNHVETWKQHQVIFSIIGSELKNHNINATKSRSASIVSYIAESNMDLKFAIKMSIISFINNPFSIQTIKRLLAITVKFMGNSSWK